MSRARTAGIIGIVVTAMLGLLAMNAGRLPVIGEGGREVTARFADIGGLAAGDRVEIAGVDVGRVTRLDMGAGHIRVTFTVPEDQRLGSATRAAIKVSNLLGSKHVEVMPAGDGDLDGEVPLDRTTSPYDLTTAFQELTSEVEPIDTEALERALTTVADTFRHSGGDVRNALRGLSAVSRTAASRDQEISSLLDHAEVLTGSLDRSRDDIARVLRAARLLLAELDRRREAIHGLIVHTRDLARELRGLVADNAKQLQPTLTALARVTQQLQQRQKDLEETIHGVAKFARVFVNTIGGGPWFDSYIGNAPDSLKLEDPR